MTHVPQEWQSITAPQFGIWSTQAPRTSNPARHDKPAPPTPETRAKLAALRAEFAERAKVKK